MGQYCKIIMVSWMILSMIGKMTDTIAGDCIVEFESVQQHMTGFGGSTAWAGGLDDDLIHELFSPEDGCGLTLVRMRIAPNGTTGPGEIDIAKKAQDLGASIWAAPWSPPGEWKDNNSVNNGGSLLPEHYQDWADRLVSYVEDLKSQGVDLKWISAQNEPNWTAEYESCRYTPEELAVFVGEYLGPTLERAGLDTRIIAPEVINWGSLKPYGDAILNSSDAVQYCDVIASHSYGDEPTASRGFPYELVVEKGKELWETEYGFDQFAGDESMTPGIAIAKQMHGQIVNGPISAYHTWWIIPADGVDGTASNGLVMRGHVIQRGYVMGNYSRFVRPGSFRINANENPSEGVYVTAYRNDSLGQLSIVAINENDYATEQRFELNNVSVSTFTPWETSEDVKLTDREQVDAGTGFSWTLPATSVVTFVGSYGSGYSLTLETTGQGTVSRDPEEILFEEGTTVTLTAEPDQGWEFVSWSGEGISSSETSIDITMDSEKTVSVLFSRSPDEEGNYVLNGNFSSDADNWTLNVWEGDASGSVVDGEYQISIESIGSESYQIQLVQPGLFLEQGETYQVSFDAYAASERELEVNVEMAEDPWDSYLPELEYFDLTTEKERYSFTFTMEDTTDVNGRLSFNAGSSVEDVYLGNVAVKEYNTPVDSPIKGLIQYKGVSVNSYKSYIKVEFTADQNSRVDINLYNLKGKLVKSESVSVGEERFNSHIFDLNGMASGLYIINVCIGESIVRSEKIIMNNLK